jgi:hypothetical protein
MRNSALEQHDTPAAVTRNHIIIRMGDFPRGGDCVIDGKYIMPRVDIFEYPTIEIMGDKYKKVPIADFGKIAK